MKNATLLQYMNRLLTVSLVVGLVTACKIEIVDSTNSSTGTSSTTISDVTDTTGTTGTTGTTDTTAGTGTTTDTTSGSTSTSSTTTTSGTTTTDTTVTQPAPVVVQKGSATLSWTAPTTRADGSALTTLAGYKIYYGLSANQMTTVVNVNSAGLTSYVIDNLDPNTYYFSITAYDNIGVESTNSNIANKTI